MSAVEPELVEYQHSALDRLWPLLGGRVSPVYPRDMIVAGIETGDLVLFPTPKAGLLAHVIKHPTGLRECHVFGGGDPTEILLIVPSVESFARNRGCNLIAIEAGGQWRRGLDGYREGPAILTRDLP